MSTVNTPTNLGRRGQQAQARLDLVDQARALMSLRLGDANLTLPVIADELYVSRRHLQRAFAQAGSKGFRDEITRMRVREAARLIHATPQMSVAAVASAVGYRQAPQFAKTFRALAGRAPGAWRRQCLQSAAKLAD